MIFRPNSNRRADSQASEDQFLISRSLPLLTS